MTATVVAEPISSRRLLTALRLAGLELRLFTREPVMIVGLLAFPVATVLVLAGVFGTGEHGGFGGVEPDRYYIVGYVGVVLAYVGLVALPVQISSRREAGVSRRYRAAGVDGLSLLASNALVGVVLSVVAAVLVLGVGALVYGLPVPDDSAAVAGWVAAGIGCFVALGIALGELMPSGRAANAIGNLLFVPMFLLGGGGPPRDVMTDSMGALSDVVPISHIIGGLRVAWLSADSQPTSLWRPVAVSVLAVVVALWTVERRGAAR